MNGPQIVQKLWNYIIDDVQSALAGFAELEAGLQQIRK